MFAGTLLGGIFAIIFQPEIISQIAGDAQNYAIASYYSVMQAMFGDVSLTTPNESVNELLSTSGMRGMLDTVWLILSAMVFGGIMESAGLLKRITQPIVKYAKSTGSLVASTVGTCVFFNTTASDQYIALVVPGRMYRKTYEEMKAITVDKINYGAEWRQHDFNFFTSDVCKQLLKEEMIQLITWKEIKNKLFSE